MTTQVFKAKDVRSAIGLVSEEFGDEAIILSTKKNNGLVEIEASNNNEVLTSFPKKNKSNKNFSKLFFKNLEKKNYKSPEDTLKKTNEFSKENNLLNNHHLEKLNKEIESIRKEISGLILTDQSSLCDNLSHSTPIQLRKENFSPKLINELSFSYQGKNVEEGKVSFFRQLAKRLTSSDFTRVLKAKNIFIIGNSGSGKSTLVAKLGAHISDIKKTKEINFINISNSSTNHSELLRGYSRVLGFRMKDFKSFNFNQITEQNEKDVVNIFEFSGDVNFGLQKINEIRMNYKNFDFCTILALQSGSNSAMINTIWSKVSDIKPMIALTKLDECWTGAEELSAIALNKGRIGIVTGTKVIIDSILPTDENSLTKYMKENFQGV